MIYLFFQTWIWLLLAALLGLLIGWLIWRKDESGDCSVIQVQLDDCKRRCAELESANQISNRITSQVSESDLAESLEPVQPVDELEPEFLDEPDGEADDLKRISGIGPVLEKTLNNLGIFHFKQIAAFTSDNIDWVNKYLSFSGRIERENWVEQARKLADGSVTGSPNRYDEQEESDL